MNMPLNEIILSMIAIPWLVWVTVSIFTQRQEVALLKQELHFTKKIYETLTDHFPILPHRKNQA